MKHVPHLVTPAGAACLLVLLAPRAGAQQPAYTRPARIAYVNSQVILANTPGRAQAESLFAAEMSLARDQVQRMQTELDSAVASYTRRAPSMTQAARTRRERQLQSQQEQVQLRTRELDSTMSARQAQLSGPIMQRVNAIIEALRAELDLSLIVDVAAQNNNIVAADQTLDITGLVIRRLQGIANPPADTSRARPDTTRARPDTTAAPQRRP